MDNLKKEKKKVGIGTLSLVAALIGISAYSYGIKYKKDFAAKFGVGLSIFMLVIITFAATVSYLI